MFTGLVDAVGTIDRVTETSAGREFLIRSRYDDLDGWRERGRQRRLPNRSRSCRWPLHGRGGRYYTGSHDDGRLGGGQASEPRACPQGVRSTRRPHRAGPRGWRRAPCSECGSSMTRSSSMWRCRTEIAELLVPHGSITVDGVSLTVNAIPEPSVVQLSLIDYHAAPHDARRSRSRAMRCTWRAM